MSPADLYIALWLLSHSAASVPYSRFICSNSSTPPLCTAQISSASLPFFGSLYDGDYPLPPAQGFPGWFFSYQDRKTHGTAPPASCTDSSKPTLDGGTPSMFTFSPDPSPAQADRFEACHDKAS
ncbi:conserved hypothetical protein [Nitrospira defluvii]|uniref:Secreted protein n=1 Tax=Nitrospira defluvii TaxID=330214 RepID=A0ABM8R4U6_9BACT|nr:conserved hypothetical protein [Nitrospira defluvii]